MLLKLNICVVLAKDMKNIYIFESSEFVQYESWLLSSPPFDFSEMRFSKAYSKCSKHQKKICQREPVSKLLQQLAALFLPPPRKVLQKKIYHEN